MAADAGSGYPSAGVRFSGFLPRARFGELIEALARSGRRIIGPTVDQGAVVYDEIRSAADLPAGVRDDQAPGRYGLHDAGDDRLFAYAVGPTAWKRFLFPPERIRMRTGNTDGDGDADGGGGDARAVDPAVDDVAFLGVRACDIAAMSVQDRVFGNGVVADPHYTEARRRALVIAVQCTHAAATCFCTSMETGPEVRAGFDLRLTELDDGYVLDVGTDAGADIAVELDLEAPVREHVAAADAAVAHTRHVVDTQNAPLDAQAARLLKTRPQHPRWADVAERCLACTNCTIVCPTCFCSKDVDVSELTSTDAAVERRWDSCFTLGFAEVAGGNFRSRVPDRYRQWLTHKFSTWWDQFGTTGCIGCGRCIVWCPVGIDVREEVTAITGDLDASQADGPQTAGRDADGTDLQTALGFADRPPEPVPAPTEVLDVALETADTATLTLAAPDGAMPAPGQFVLAALDRIGAPPISVSRVDDSSSGRNFEITVRAMGAATAELCRVVPGDRIGVAGPYGTGWPLAAAEGGDVVIVGGGIGLAPLRPVIDHVLTHRERFGSVHVYAGARTPEDMPFADEIAEWELRPDADVARIVDRAGPDWLGPVGIVTQLFDTRVWDGTRTTAYVCGPERMMQAVAETLADAGLEPESIYLTTERHMECGVGLCGHCQLGPFLLCRDGPVLSAARLAPYLGVEGI